VTARPATTATPVEIEAPSLAQDAGALVQFDGICRHWGRGKRRWAVLRDVDLHVRAGTVTCIGGQNGAGKTTLLRIATGIIAPDAGTVTIDGLTCEAHWREYHRRIGFLSAGDRGLYARFNVRGHIDFCARMAFVPRARRRQTVDDALERFGLQDLAKRRADRLSQGQRQRLRLALTFVHEPSVLLLDEPRNSLDSDGLEILTKAISDTVQRGGAVLWAAPAGESQPFPFDRSFVIEDGLLKPA
jgi:ABC-2 type transport system ATP-binding protein